MALVDTQHVHGGANAVHFHGNGSPAFITRPLPAGTNRLYVRAYVYTTRQLGMTPSSASPNHETLVGIRKTSGDASNEVRFGEIKGALGTNEVPSDDISPPQARWFMGPVIGANQWTCLEVAFLADQTQNALYAWADGTLVHSVTMTPAQWEHMSLPASWLGGKFGEVILGWQSFSNFTNDVWIDDVALGTDRIGCL